MIIDTLKNADLYRNLSPRIAAALKYLQTTDVTRLDPGRHELDGSDLFVMIQRYETKSPDGGKWEAHRKYIDIQFVADGTEKIGYANLDAMTVLQPYDEQGDFLLLQGPGDFLTVPAGTFVLLGPADVHMPSIAVARPQPVIKAVVKVRI
jgi:YhcH/YjgK/YiaL family protein